MKTIKAKGHRLSEGTMEKVSLVKHGANRKPFTILKARELPADGTLDKVRDKVAKMFGGGEAEAAPAKVAAIVVEKSQAKTVFPILKAAGFRVDQNHADLLDGDLIVLKQEGFDGDLPEDSTVMAVSDGVGLVLDRVVKEFSCWGYHTDFNTTMAAQSFFPCLRIATEAFMETSYAIMAEAKTPEEATSMLDAATKQFAKYTTALAKVLPSEVMKMEKSLASEFGGHTVAPTDSVSKSEPMKTDALREAVAGDLAGIFSTVEKTVPAVPGEPVNNAPTPEEIAAAKARQVEAETKPGPITDENRAAAAASSLTQPADAVDAKDAGAAEAAGAPGAEAGAGDGDAAPVAKSANDQLIDAIKNEFGKMQTAFDAKLDVLTERVAKAESAATVAVTKAEAAVTKAENTVVVHDTTSDFALDGTMATRTSQARVSKSNAPQGETVDVWKGLFPSLDSLQDASRGE